MDVKPYLQQEMYELGNGNVNSCSFDFSQISIDDYYPFFKGLPNFIYKKVEKVNFNTKLYHEYDDNDKEMSEEDQNYILNSIKTQKRKYPHYLFKILNSTLPRSTKLSSLVIDGIRIPTSYFDDFVKAASKCRTLRVLKIEDSPLSTEQFLKILKQWSPYHFKVLSFKKDHLNPTDVYKSITNYLKQPSTGKTWKLEVFSVDDNDFSSSQLSNIKKLINNQINPQNDNSNISSKRNRTSPKVQEEPQSHKKSKRSNRFSNDEKESEEQSQLEEEEEEEDFGEEEEEFGEEEEEEEEEFEEEEEEEEEAYDENE